MIDAAVLMQVSHSEEAKDDFHRIIVECVKHGKWQLFSFCHMHTVHQHQHTHPVLGEIS